MLLKSGCDGGGVVYCCVKGSPSRARPQLASRPSLALLPPHPRGPGEGHGGGVSVPPPRLPPQIHSHSPPHQLVQGEDGCRREERSPPGTKLWGPKPSFLPSHRLPPPPPPSLRTGCHHIFLELVLATLLPLSCFASTAIHCAAPLEVSRLSASVLRTCPQNGGAN